MAGTGQENIVFDKVLEGDRLSLARVLTMVENDTPKGRAALDYLYPHTGKAHLVGVTGSPGTGKSSLVTQLVKAFRAQCDAQVGVVAVDPSSPFTGGALLGDRVRMRDLSGDPGVFIRSMASRGALGGLARATASMAQVLDAAGFDIVMIETVGAGQSEIDIARLAHTVLVVEAPGLGDDIQASKAGILEIADILVVNKCDLPGAEQTARVLRSMLEMAHPTRPGHITEESFWRTPVMQTCCTGCQGAGDVIEMIQKHRGYLEQSGEWLRREQERVQAGLETMLRDVLFQRWLAALSEGEYGRVLESLSGRQVSPFEAVETLVGIKLGQF